MTTLIPGAGLPGGRPQARPYRFRSATPSRC